MLINQLFSEMGCYIMKEFKGRKLLVYVLVLAVIAGTILCFPQQAGISYADDADFTITYNSKEGFIGGNAATKTKSYKVPRGSDIGSYYVPSDCYDIDGRKAVKAWKNIATNEVISVDDMRDFIPRKDTTFEAVWGDLCIITFKSEYGGFNWSANKKEVTFYVAKGNKVPTVTIQSNPAGVNATLDGWKSDDGTVYSDIGYRHEAVRDETLTAIWTKRIALTFDCAGGYLWEGSDIETSSKTVYMKAGSNGGYGMPRPTKWDYYFDGWKLDLGDGTSKIFMDSVRGPFDNDVTVYAQWVPAYNMTFRSAEGYIYSDKNRTMETEQVKKGEKIKDFPSASGYPGHSLIGWKLEGTDKIYNKDDIRNFAPEGDVVFDAVWGESVKIIYDAGEGILGNGIGGFRTTTSFSKGSYDVADYARGAYRDGYVFRGWKAEGVDKVFFNEPISGIYNEDTTFYAIWVEEVKLSFDLNGGYYKWWDGYINDYKTSKDVKEYSIGKGETPILYYADNLSGLDDIFNDNGDVPIGWRAEGTDEILTVDQIKSMTFDTSTVFKAVWEADANPDDSGNQNQGGNDASNQNNQNNQNGSTGSTDNNSVDNNSGSAETSAPSYCNEWVNGLWYNADGTQDYPGILSWKCNSTGWWVEDTLGWYPVSQWQKIDGLWYYFDASGYMASSEWVDGYWLSSDGAWDYPETGSWSSDKNGWWYGDTSGWYASSRWQKIDGYWYYFNNSGYIVTNKYIDGYWLNSNGQYSN